MASYVIIYDSRRFVRSDSTDTTVLLPVAAGGTNANLSGTGGANQFVKQSTVGGTFTVGAIGAGDVPDAALTSNVALLNRDAQVFTGTYDQFVKVGVGAAPTFSVDVQKAGLQIIRVKSTDNSCNVLIDRFSSSFAAAINFRTAGADNHILGTDVDGGTSTTFMLTNGASVRRLAVDTNNNLILGNAALATNATDGFFHNTTCAGTPTGVPTAFTGRVPVVHDTNGNNEWQYNGGWRLAGFDVAQTLQAPAINETLTAGYSAVVNRSLTIASGKKYTIGSGARMRIL